MPALEQDKTVVDKDKQLSAFRRRFAKLTSPRFRLSSRPWQLLTSSFSSLPRTPASFPPPAQVRALGEMVQNCDSEDRTVWRMEWRGVEMYVKGGKDVDVSEAQMTKLARKKTRLPIPKVYHVEQEGDSTFIYLEALPGRNLTTALKWLSPPQEQRLQKEIERAVKRLHRVKGPAGSRVGAPTSHPLSALFAERVVAPSLHSAADFHNYLRDLYLSHNPARAEEYDREIGSRFDDAAALVLVHGDLHPHNILVQDGRLSGIIDFGRAGWYPEWVEQWAPGMWMASPNTASLHLLQTMSTVTWEGEEWRWLFKADWGWRGALPDGGRDGWP